LESNASAAMVSSCWVSWSLSAAIVEFVALSSVGPRLTRTIRREFQSSRVYQSTGGCAESWGAISGLPTGASDCLKLTSRRPVPRYPGSRKPHPENDLQRAWRACQTKGGPALALIAIRMMKLRRKLTDWVHVVTVSLSITGCRYACCSQGHGQEVGTKDKIEGDVRSPH
jgi:hypothetical protein